MIAPAGLARSPWRSSPRRAPCDAAWLPVIGREEIDGEVRSEPLDHVTCEEVGADERLIVVCCDDDAIQIACWCRRPGE